MSDNLAVWNKLSRTDPDHTKAFTRGGGFRGTAIKPIYTEMKMTETFGPCGAGWGYSEPHFQLVNCAGGEVAVFCWLNLWYRKEDGNTSDPIPGVGGDFVVKTLKGELRSDDEAFKKAATDALGNAMKHLGMSADVHMGRFEDNKYVAEVREEARQAANGNGKRKSSAQAKRDGDWPKFMADLFECETAVRLEALHKEYRANVYPAWNKDWQDQAEAAFEDRQAELTAGDLKQTLEDSVSQEPVEDDREPTAKPEYIRHCHEIIEEAGDERTLLDWWNSKEQKAARRQYELTKEEVQELMARTMEKRERVLKGAADPILEAGG